MVVKITAVLERKLAELQLNSQLFIDAFKEWKQGDEYGSYEFGKDSAYYTPPVHGENYILRHVHLVPILEVEQLSAWNRSWRFKRRKTSNRALVYVSDNRGKFLLITILDEPKAHSVVLMKTQEDRDLMIRFAKIAEVFISDGSVMA